MSYYARSNNYRHNDYTGVKLIVGFVVLVVVLCIASIVIIHSTAKYETFTVSDKAVVSDGNNGHEYQIFTTTDDVYADNDSFSYLKFNSSNVYGQLQVHHTYRCLVTGFRIPILSKKNNIIRCTEVSK